MESIQIQSIQMCVAGVGIAVQKFHRGSFVIYEYLAMRIYTPCVCIYVYRVYNVRAVDRAPSEILPLRCVRVARVLGRGSSGIEQSQHFQVPLNLFDRVELQLVGGRHKPLLAGREAQD